VDEEPAEFHVVGLTIDENLSIPNSSTRDL
jgi:hypothetical protein